jgi:hypothetical protein
MGLCFFVRDWIVNYQKKASQQQIFFFRRGKVTRRGKDNTYGIPIPSNTPKNLPSLHSPNPVLQQCIQQEIHPNSPFHPYRFCSFPAQLAVQIERDAGNCDGGISQDEADGGFGVVACKGVGLRESAEVWSKGVVGCTFQICL